MANKTKRILSAACILAVILSAAAPAVSAAGDDIIKSRNFDRDLFEILLEEADADGDGELSEYEASQIQSLNLSGMGLTSLEGLEYLPNLSYLDASDNDLSSVSSMGDCEYLTYLDLSDNDISNLSGLNRLENLEELDLSGNRVSSVSSLKHLDYLESLDLSDNRMSSSSSLSSLESVTHLVLDHNSLREIDNLPGNLVYLSARGNEITDMRSVVYLRDLETLDLSDNRIVEVPDMSRLEYLQNCYLDHNEIEYLNGGWEQADCTVNLSYNLLDTSSDEVKDAVSALSKDGNSVIILPQRMEGWQYAGNKTYYFLDDEGTYATGTRTIDGQSYTFDQYGVLNGSGQADNGGQTDGNGWVTEGGSKYYRENGQNVTGWKIISGSYYYFDSTGKMLTGWQKYNGTWYYLDPQTGVMKTGWLQLGNTWYYLQSWGGMVTGNQTIDGKSYTFNASGALTQGTPPGGSGTGTGGPTGSGWVTADGGKYYQKEDGSYQKGWLLLNGSYYYMDPQTGKMLTGWQQVGGTWYYMDPSTGVMKTGWLNLNGIWYYLLSWGGMVTGTQTIDGVSYNFNSNGSLNGTPPANAGSGSAGSQFPSGNGWTTENGVTTYTGSNGQKATGWLLYEGSYYYLDPSSGALQTGWKQVNGSWYYLDPQTGKMRTGWVEVGGQKYYLHNWGGMAVGWFHTDDDSKTWYVSKASGELMTSQWYYYKNEYYYLGANGAAANDWAEIGGKWYYFNADAVMQKNAWIPTFKGDSWCYVGSDGAMLTGWNYIGGKWYYMRQSDGYCLVNGWYTIDGKTYYFYQDASMAVNTTINGYKVGADGAWIQ